MQTTEVIFLLAILILTLAIAAPAVKTELMRDREIETMQRGKQYVRGIQLYYRKFGRYPPSVDALVKPTNGIRFLRKKYIDPTTGKDEWRPIHVGQNKTPTAMGFFGQPLVGSTIAGTGPGGTPGASNLGSPIGSSSGFGSSPTGFGTPTSGLGSSSSGFGSTPTGSGSDLTNPTGTTGTTGTAANPGDSSTSTGASSSPTTGVISSGTSGTSAFGGQTFGGAGIIGFAPTSPKQSHLVYKKKNHYNEWEFVYDPITDRKTVSGSSGPSGSQPAAGISTGIGRSGSSIGGSGSGIGGGSTGSGGTNPGGSTPTPQQ